VTAPACMAPALAWLWRIGNDDIKIRSGAIATGESLSGLRNDYSGEHELPRMWFHGSAEYCASAGPSDVGGLSEYGNVWNCAHAIARLVSAGALHDGRIASEPVPYSGEELRPDVWSRVVRDQRMIGERKIGFDIS
jgi:hypothetical protein